MFLICVVKERKDRTHVEINSYPNSMHTHTPHTCTDTPHTCTHTHTMHTHTMHHVHTCVHTQKHVLHIYLFLGGCEASTAKSNVSGTSLGNGVKLTVCMSGDLIWQKGR